MPPDPRDVLTRPAAAPDRTVRFGPGPHQVYELYEPLAGRDARCLVVLVHGGFWRSGYDRTHLRPLASALARLGHAVALLEYRGTGADGGGWPETFEDVRAALAAVREHEEPAYGAPALMGHSAGAHLAVWLLHQPEGRGVRGAVSLAGCLDLDLAAALELDDGAVADLVRGDPRAQPALMARIDPAALGPTQVPVLLVHGEDDVHVPLEVAESWLARAGTTGRDLMTIVARCEHFGVIDPHHHAFPTVAAQVLALPGGTDE